MVDFDNLENWDRKRVNSNKTAEEKQALSKAIVKQGMLSTMGLPQEVRSSSQNLETVNADIKKHWQVIRDAIREEHMNSKMPAQADFDKEINKLFTKDDYFDPFNIKQEEIDQEMEDVIEVEQSKNPGISNFYLEQKIDEIQSQLLNFNSHVYDCQVGMQGMHKTYDSNDNMMHDRKLSASKLQISAFGVHQDMDQKKHQQENEKEKVFKAYLNNAFLKVKEKDKELYELDPIELSIAEISNLNFDTKLVPEETDGQGKFESLKRQRELIYEQFDSLAESLRETATDELSRSLGMIDEVPKDQLADLVLRDRPVLSSTVLTAENMLILKTDLTLKRPTVGSINKLQQSLKPEWYEIPQPNKQNAYNIDQQLQINPGQITQVDFERDLGYMQRQTVVDFKSKELVKNQKTVFDKMTHFESLDEIYLMVVAGLANIQKIRYLAKMAPELDPYPIPEKPDIPKSTIKPPVQMKRRGSASRMFLRRQSTISIGGELLDSSRGTTTSMSSAASEESKENPDNNSNVDQSQNDNDVPLLELKYKTRDKKAKAQQIVKEDHHDRKKSDELSSSFLNSTMDRHTNAQSAAEKESTPGRQRAGLRRQLNVRSKSKSSRGSGKSVETSEDRVARASRIILKIDKVWAKYSEVQLDREISQAQRVDHKSNDAADNKIDQLADSLLNQYKRLFKLLEDFKEEEDSIVVEQLNLDKVFQQAALFQNEEELISGEAQAKFLTKLVSQYNRLKERKQRILEKEQRKNGPTPEQIEAYRQMVIWQNEKNLKQTASPNKANLNFIKKHRTVNNSANRGQLSSKSGQVANQQSNRRGKWVRDSSNDLTYFNRSTNDGQASVGTTSQGWGVGVPLRQSQQNHFGSQMAIKKKSSKGTLHKGNPQITSTLSQDVLHSNGWRNEPVRDKNLLYQNNGAPYSFYPQSSRGANEYQSSNYSGASIQYLAGGLNQANLLRSNETQQTLYSQQDAAMPFMVDEDQWIGNKEAMF